MPDQRHEPDQKKERRVMDLDTALREIVLAKDPRYPVDAYRFLYEALDYTQKTLERDPGSEKESERHVSGHELLEGIRDYASRQFGMLAPAVFRQWGIRRTDDFGEMVFNLVEAGLMSRTARDSRDDFSDGFDFDEAFNQPISR